MKINQILKDKKFSVLGDSLSTYKGYNTDASSNATLINNKTYYNGKNIIRNVKHTWWMRTINKTRMKLLVNNSSSGSKIKGIGNISNSTIDEAIGIRSENLHNNIKNINPDIIAVFIGINDYNANTNLKEFAKSYEILIKKIINKYKKSEIFLFTLLPNKNTKNDLEEYNNEIIKISKKYNLNIVDLYNKSKIKSKNIKKYTSDDKNLHLNSKGMKKVSKVFIKQLKNKYLH